MTALLAGLYLGLQAFSVVMVLLAFLAWRYL